MSKSSSARQKSALDPLFLHKRLQENYNKPVDPNASFFLGGVLQYLGSEILEKSYQLALQRPGSQITITPNDVLKVIEEDADLSYLIRLKPKEDDEVPMDVDANSAQEK